MHRRQLDAEKLLLEAAPDGVFFVALERQELRNGYLCYYAVAKDPENPRDKFKWRVTELDYELLMTGKFEQLWGGWIDGVEGDAARAWVEKQTAAIEPLEELLVIAGRHTEYHERCAKEFEWHPDWGVFTLLPHEMRGRVEIAKEMLSESLNAAKTVS